MQLAPVREAANNTPVPIGEVLPKVIDDIEVIHNHHNDNEEAITTESHPQFIGANTISLLLDTILKEHAIPVFARENDSMISHGEFIQTTYEAVTQLFGRETILKPNIRLSHPIKGRIPQARNKPKNELLPHETTLYYERMAFIIEIPSIQTVIDGNLLNLTVGGIKAYNLDNLLSRNNEQQFKLFIGFQNKVCTNLCVSTDGFAGNVKVKSVKQLKQSIEQLFSLYNPVQFSEELSNFINYELTDKQFAQLIGRCKMYKHLSETMKSELPVIQLGDAQINTICKDYYSDQSFCCDASGNINLWKLYNLFTGANKSSYIDSFLDRSVHSFSLAKELMLALQNGSNSWFLN